MLWFHKIQKNKYLPWPLWGINQLRCIFPALYLKELSLDNFPLANFPRASFLTFLQLIRGFQIQCYNDEKQAKIAFKTQKYLQVFFRSFKKATDAGGLRRWSGENIGKTCFWWRKWCYWGTERQQDNWTRRFFFKRRGFYFILIFFVQILAELRIIK